MLPVYPLPFDYGPLTQNPTSDFLASQITSAEVNISCKHPLTNCTRSRRDETDVLTWIHTLCLHDILLNLVRAKEDTGLLLRKLTS